MREAPALVDPAIGRQQLAEHHARCAPCQRLYLYARDRADREALAAWRHQLAAHVTADAERRAHVRSLHRWLLAGMHHPQPAR